MGEAELLRTTLHDRHVARGAQMGGEDGWEMPLRYGSVIDEVAAVRRRAGIFDVSHLGRIRIRGDGALDLLERVCTADVAHQEDDTATYTLLCNDAGGILEDSWLIRLENFWVLTTNAGNRGKVLGHLRRHAAHFDCKVDDQTSQTSHVAVAGPGARDALDAVLPLKVSPLPPRSVKFGFLLIARYIALRIGYCGEWSLEVILTNLAAGPAWRFVTEKAGASAIGPVGLAAREILRIEAGLPRYGRELNDAADPITAGLESALDFGHEFIGVSALARLKEAGTSRRRVGLAFAQHGESEPEAIPNQGASIGTTDGTQIGAITSATFSPTLGRAIAMGYVASDAAPAGTQVLVDEAGKSQAAEVVTLPFYRRPS